MEATKNSKIVGKPLSARAIETMKPGDKIKADIGENSGLRVQCGSGGTKSFAYRYKSPETGKLTQVKIGNYPSVSLAEARVELHRLKVLRKSGVCPKAYRHNEKEAVKKLNEEKKHIDKADAFTIEELVEFYLCSHIEDRTIAGVKRAGARKPKGQRETRRTLYGDAVRVLGNMPADKVTRKTVVNLIMAIVERGANVQAGNVLRELSAAYEYAIGLERFDESFVNPAVLAKASLRQAKVKLTSNKGRRTLSDRELKQVLEWLPSSGFSYIQKNIIRFTLWTGCRSGEACLAEWADIDLDKATWHMKDSKNGSERYVQLSRQTVAFLQQLKLNTKIYLFPSNSLGKPIQQKSLTETKWQMKNPEKLTNRRRISTKQMWINTIDDWSPHDLRRTVRTGLSRLGCRSEVAEAVLGHSRKGIEGTYDLHAYEEECSEWLQIWADHLEVLMK